MWLLLVACLLYLQAVSRGLIMWDEVEPSQDWIKQQLPSVRLVPSNFKLSLSLCRCRSWHYWTILPPVLDLPVLSPIPHNPLLPLDFVLSSSIPLLFSYLSSPLLFPFPLLLPLLSSSVPFPSSLTSLLFPSLYSSSSPSTLHLLCLFHLSLLIIFSVFCSIHLGCDHVTLFMSWN